MTYSYCTKNGDLTKDCSRLKNKVFEDCMTRGTSFVKAGFVEEEAISALVVVHEYKGSEG